MESAQVVRVAPEAVAVDFVEISFKDQYISRADMWRFKMALVGQCVYRGKLWLFSGLRVAFEELLVAGMS